METLSCRPETLLTGDSCDIQYCFDCKMMHLNLGAVTLRLSRRQFDEFMADLTKGATNLRQREHGQNTFDWSNVTTLNS
jgi:hypothetical protein